MSEEQNRGGGILPFSTHSACRQHDPLFHPHGTDVGLVLGYSTRMLGEKDSNVDYDYEEAADISPLRS